MASLEDWPEGEQRVRPRVCVKSRKDIDGNGIAWIMIIPINIENIRYF